MQDMQVAKTPDGRLLAVFMLRLPPGDALATRAILYVRMPSASSKATLKQSSSCAGLKHRQARLVRLPCTS